LGWGGSLFWSGYEWFGEKPDFGISDELSRNQVLSQARTEIDKNNKPIASKTKLWRIERLNFPPSWPALFWTPHATTQNQVIPAKTQRENGALDGTLLGKVSFVYSY
jgi:hypothetical protein